MAHTGWLLTPHTRSVVYKLSDRDESLPHNRLIQTFESYNRVNKYAALAFAIDNDLSSQFDLLRSDIPEDLSKSVVTDPYAFAYVLEVLVSRPSSSRVTYLDRLLASLRYYLYWNSIRSICLPAFMKLLDDDGVHSPDVDSTPQQEMISMLLPNVSNPNVVGRNYGHNALDIALLTGSAMLLTACLENNFELVPQGSKRPSPLKAAIALYEQSPTSEHKRFCEIIINIHLVSATDACALMSYLWQWCYRISAQCALLLEPYKAYLPSTLMRDYDAHGFTPLHRAVITGHQSAVRAFLNMGADPLQLTIAPQTKANAEPLIAGLDLVGMDALSLACATRVLMASTVLDALFDLPSKIRDTRTDTHHALVLLFTNRFVWRSGGHKDLLVHPEARIAAVYAASLCHIIPRILKCGPKFSGKYAHLLSGVGKDPSALTGARLVEVMRRISASENKPEWGC